jgi:hypothetical protein
MSRLTFGGSTTVLVRDGDEEGDVCVVVVSTTGMMALMAERLLETSESPYDGVAEEIMPLNCYL